MSLYRTDGVVLRTYKLGEADRIVVVLTRERGKVRAVAKGVRRTKSKFGARLEPGSNVHLQLYEGRGELDIVTQVETAMRLPTLRTDLERYHRATVLLEVADHATLDGEPHPALFKLLSGALAELERSGNPLVVPAFVTKVLALDGVQPLLDQCVVCGRADELVAIDLESGGVTCRDDRRGEAIAPEVLAALSSILQGRVRAVLDHSTPQVRQDLEALGVRLAEHHLERRLRSTTVLEPDGSIEVTRPRRSTRAADVRR